MLCKIRYDVKSVSISEQNILVVVVLLFSHRFSRLIYQSRTSGMRRIANKKAVVLGLLSITAQWSPKKRWVLQSKSERRGDRQKTRRKLISFFRERLLSIGLRNNCNEMLNILCFMKFDPLFWSLEALTFFVENF